MQFVTMIPNTWDNLKLINDFIGTSIHTPSRAVSIASSDVVVLPILNWASMCSSENLKRLQGELFGPLVNSDTQTGTIGLVVMPLVGGSHGTHGQLWRYTLKAHEMLYSYNVDPDRYFILQYDERADQRNERPLLVKIVAATPLSTELSKKALSMWKNLGSTTPA